MKKILRKVLLVAFLAAAGLLVGEVYQRFAGKSPEAILEQLHATVVMTEGMEVNGVPVVAKVYQLPEVTSSAMLKKARGQVLIVGRRVYVFDQKIKPLKGSEGYPADLPTLSLDVDYVVSAMSGRYVSGHSALSVVELEEQLAQTAKAQGWAAFSPVIYQKGNQAMLLTFSEGRQETRVAIAVVQMEAK